MASRLASAVLVAGVLLGSGCEINTKIDADGAVNGPKVGNGNGNGNGNGSASGDGVAALFVVELDCAFLWDLEGSQTSCSDCDIAFDVTGSDARGECGNAPDIAGELVADNGAVYFDGQYWGVLIEEGSGSLYWYTYDYLYGQDYSYLYAGYFDY